MILAIVESITPQLPPGVASESVVDSLQEVSLPVIVPAFGNGTMVISFDTIFVPNTFEMLYF